MGSWNWSSQTTEQFLKSNEKSLLRCNRTFFKLCFYYADKASKSSTAKKTNDNMSSKPRKLKTKTDRNWSNDEEDEEADEVVDEVSREIHENNPQRRSWSIIKNQLNLGFMKPKSTSKDPNNNKKSKAKKSKTKTAEKIEFHNSMKTMRRRKKTMM